MKGIVDYQKRDIPYSWMVQKENYEKNLTILHL